MFRYYENDWYLSCKYCLKMFIGWQYCVKLNIFYSALKIIIYKFMWLPTLLIANMSR